MKKVRIIKISDDIFNGIHPNNINTGYVKEGYELDPLKVGERYCVGSLRTSLVTEIVSDTIFKTENSTYKIEYLD